MTSSGAREPLLSVILATPDSYDTIRRTISFLRAQTIKERLEIVIVTPSDNDLELDDEELAVFQCVRVVKSDSVLSAGSANCAGVRGASAPIVAMAETHAFSNPEWAAALVEAHRGPWAAVGPAMLNANPRSVLSWASFLLTYGRWAGSPKAGPVGDLPGHNSSYKRDALLAYDRDLERLFETETLMHWDLLAKGNQLYLEPAAKISHVNPTRMGSYLLESFMYARTFGARRTYGWPAIRRLAYFAAAPLIIATRLARLSSQLRGMKPLPFADWQILGVALLGLASATLGEVIGAQFGAGDAAWRQGEFEFHRERHVASEDLACLRA